MTELGYANLVPNRLLESWKSGRDLSFESEYKTFPGLGKREYAFPSLPETFYVYEN